MEAGILRVSERYKSQSGRALLQSLVEDDLRRKGITMPITHAYEQVEKYLDPEVYERLHLSGYVFIGVRWVYRGLL